MQENKKICNSNSSSRKRKIFDFLGLFITPKKLLVEQMDLCQVEVSIKRGTSPKSNFHSFMGRVPLQDADFTKSFVCYFSQFVRRTIYSTVTWPFISIGRSQSRSWARCWFSQSKTKIFRRIGLIILEKSSIILLLSHGNLNVFNTPWRIPL